MAELCELPDTIRLRACVWPVIMPYGNRINFACMHSQFLTDHKPFMEILLQQYYLFEHAKEFGVSAKPTRTSPRYCMEVVFKGPVPSKDHKPEVAAFVFLKACTKWTPEVQAEMREGLIAPVQKAMVCKARAVCPLTPEGEFYTDFCFISTANLPESVQTAIQADTQHRGPVVGWIDTAMRTAKSGLFFELIYLMDTVASPPVMYSAFPMEPGTYPEVQSTNEALAWVRQPGDTHVSCNYPWKM